MSVQARLTRPAVPQVMDPFGIKPWHRLALCVTNPVDPEMFYERARWQEAKAFCRGCPVRADCLAEFWDDGWAVAGGLDPDERRLARRKGLL